MIKLTQTVKKGGCAAKVAAHELREILDRLRFPQAQPGLAINGADFDDAAVYKISDAQSLVSTLDFFTPIVDSPRLFGEIAAANAMSDVYAMGGVPRLALAILAFPVLSLDQEVVAEILQGAVDTLERAHADLAGGHSIDDDTLKFGLSVTGIVENASIWTNAGAQPGDCLVLTKGLGTGTLMASLKNEVLSAEQLEDAFSSMRQLNDILSLIDDEDREAIHAATDVTGFGVAGHAYQMAKASGVSLNIQASRLPLLEHVKMSLEANSLTKAHRTNREYTSECLERDQDISLYEQLLFFDPQTSGGLLLAVDEKRASVVCEKIQRGFSKAALIGEVVEKGDRDLYYLK